MMLLAQCTSAESFCFISNARITKVTVAEPPALKFVKYPAVRGTAGTDYNPAQGSRALACAAQVRYNMPMKCHPCASSGRLLAGALWVWFVLLAAPCAAQNNYEIQVYGAETVPARALMVETHSNFTFQGTKTLQDGVRPTHHQFRETLELTYGFNDWFETGFYVFTAAQSGYGWQWVGDHLRPRVRVPEKWHWPVGVSLSSEIGYQRRQYSTDTWTFELRPIVDKKIGKWYMAANPALEKSLHGLNQNKTFEFSPAAKISYDVVPKVSVGLEYYGGNGPINGFDPVAEQQHQFMPVVDLNVSEKWEFNFGVGVGVTRSTDHWLVKAIVGRRFSNFPLRRREPRTLPPPQPDSR